MNNISQLRQNASNTVTAVRGRFENIRSLDQNPLFDTDSRVGHVAAAADSWTSVASFEESGEPLSFQWVSSVPNEHAESEMDAAVLKDTESIERKNGTTTFKQEHSGPTPYGFGHHNSGTIAVLDSESQELMDATGW